MILYGGYMAAFCAMPKTGSSYVNHCMNAVGLASMSDGMHGHDLEHVWRYKRMGSVVFTVVRRPDSWLTSYYRHAHRSDGRIEPMGGPCCLLAPWLNQSHEDFCDSISRIPHILDHLYQCYSKLCDYLLRTEQLTDDLILLLERCGHEFDRKLIADQPRQNVREGEAPGMNEVTLERLKVHNPVAWRIWCQSGLSE